MRQPQEIPGQPAPRRMLGPIGSIQAGGLATLFGAPWAMAIGAVVAGAVVLAIRITRPHVFAPPQLEAAT